MAHAEKILRFMTILMIATKHDIAAIMSAMGIWRAGASTVTNSHRELKRLSGLGKLIEENGYYRIPSSRGEHGKHSRALTKALVTILKDFPDACIYREHFIPEINLRADALVLLPRDGMATAFALEVVNEESYESIMKKYETWRDWDNRAKYFSELFQLEVPFVDFVVEGRDNLPFANIEYGLFPERNL